MTYTEVWSNHYIDTGVGAGTDLNTGVGIAYQPKDLQTVTYTVVDSNHYIDTGAGADSDLDTGVGRAW